MNEWMDALFTPAATADNDLIHSTAVHTFIRVRTTEQFTFVMSNNEETVIDAGCVL